MILEALTLILCTALGYFLGRFVNILPIKHNGWEIMHWKGHGNDAYYFTASRNGKRTIVVLSSNGDVDFDYEKDVFTKK